MHYTHLTVFLFAQFSYFFLKFSSNHLLKYELSIYFTALILVFTWSAFSLPFFMFVIFSGLILIKFKQNILRSFMIFCTFTLLSLTLSIKNKIEFNMFASSTWIGMQLFTVLSYGDKRDYWGICNFSYKNIEKDESAFKKNNPTFKNSHPSLIGNLTKLNNVGFIHRSKKCLDLAIKEIVNDPLDYINRAKFLFISNLFLKLVIICIFSFSCSNLII